MRRRKRPDWLSCAAAQSQHGVDGIWVSNHGGRQLDHGKVGGTGQHRRTPSPPPPSNLLGNKLPAAFAFLLARMPGMLAPFRCQSAAIARLLRRPASSSLLEPCCGEEH